MADAVSFDKAALAWTLPWDADWVTAVCFAAAGRKVAAGNNLGQILVWDLPEKPGGPPPAPGRKLEGHTNVISRLLCTPDGRWLISSSYDHTIRFWDLQGEAKGGATVVLNEGGRARAAGRRGARVPPPVEVKVAVQQSARTLAGHRDWVTALTLSRDGKLLVSGDDEGQVVVWDAAAGTQQKRWQVKGWVYALALSPDAGTVFASERVPLVFDSGRHAGARLWDRAAAKPRHDLGPQLKNVYISCAAWSPDGKVLALGRGGETDGMNGVVHLVDPAAGKVVRTLTPGHQYGATDLAFHRDGRHLASVGRDTTVRIWDVAAGKQVKQLGTPRGGQFKDWLHAVAFSGDGGRLAAADMAGAVQVWSLGG